MSDDVPDQQARDKAAEALAGITLLREVQKLQYEGTVKALDTLNASFKSFEDKITMTISTGQKAFIGVALGVIGYLFIRAIGWVK